MKPLLVLTFACLFAVAFAGPVFSRTPEDLHIVIRLKVGEHSKDSSSRTTTITVEGNEIVLGQSFTGRRRGESFAKTFALSSANQAALAQLVESNQLLATDAIELPLGQRYFEISITITLNGKEGLTKLSGPRSAISLKEEKLYKNSMVLVHELYQIMKSQDKSIVPEELIMEATE